jgi:hypothetical protein
LKETKSKSALVQTMIPATGELLAQTNSIERMKISLATTDAKELYEELKKMRNSIGMAFESNQTPSDMEGDKPLPVS